MICPTCGTAAMPGARFCSHCGTSLLGRAGSDAQTERRVVTILFGDLSDFTSWSEDLDPERVGVVTDRVMQSLAAVVGDHGGYVDKLTGDGIMAVFGAPVAHEDDTERAVRAAARMQSVVRRLVAEESGGGRRLGLRVGLNTGEVVAGVQAGLSYTVIGDAVNTASRLADTAGVGAVLAGRETASGTLEAASWRALEPLRLKGKREPVVAYELVAVRPKGASRLGLGDEAPFLGRDEELGVLVSAALDTAERDRPSIVLISGEAGVGKTRLAHEVGRFLGELPGARVLWGRCTPYGEGRDLVAVADLVRMACGVVDSDDVDTARGKVARTVSRLEAAGPAPLPAGTAEQLRALLGLEELTPALREGAMPGAPVGGDRLRQALSALFQALSAEGPLLLVLDDMHWATRTVLDGLRAVVELTSTGSIVLLVLGRPDMLEVHDQAWWSSLGEVALLPLAPLDEAAAEALLRAYLGSPEGELDHGVREALLRRAEGNPFFLAELLHLLVDRGLLRRVAGGWRMEDSAGARLEGELLPAGVQAVLAARIDGLDGAAKGVLRDASVLGLVVDRPALQAVGAASGHGQPEVVEAAVATLVDRRLLEPSPDDERTLHFGHTLVRDVAYAGLAKVERARRHAAAAEHVVQVPLRSSESDSAAAAHGERAVELAREMGLGPHDAAWRARGVAYAALARLGQAAINRDDFHVARSQLARALRLAEPGAGEPLPDDLVLPVRVALAEALVALGHTERAEEQLVEALQAQEDGLRAAALLVAGEARRKRHDDDGARQAFVSALTAASNAGIDRLTGEALRQLGLLDYFAWNLRSAEERFRQAHDLAVRVHDPRGAGWALQHLAWSATSRGDFPLAEQVLDAAREVFSELQDTGGLSWVAGTEGFVRLLQGRLLEARALAGSVLPLGEAIGERWGVASLLLIDALAAAELGAVTEAEAEATLALQRFSEVGDEWGQGFATLALGVVARARGQFDRAVQLLDRSIAMVEATQPGMASIALVVGGYAHLDRGDLESAEAAAFRATALLSGLDLEESSLVGAKVLLAQVLRRNGRLVEALAEVDAALEISERSSLLFPRRQGLSHRAGILLDLGRVEDALEAARVAVASPGDDVRSEVLSLRALGSALRACGEHEQARAVLVRALAIARSTEMAAEVAVTERLLDPG